MQHDVVHANVHARGAAAGVFNVAAGTRISVNDLAGMIMGVIGNRVHEEQRAGDVRVRSGVS